MKKIGFFSMGTLLSLLLIVSNVDKKPVREFYRLTVYHFTGEPQEKMLDNYLQNALLPALHRIKINNVGVFKAWSNDTSTNKLMYVFIAVRTVDMLTKISEKLAGDERYSATAAEFLNASHTNPPYARMETILLEAFPLAPQMQLPMLQGPRKERVYELRSYESATEQKFNNKVDMFNKGDEIGLFKRLNFNAVFYASVMAGSRMPNLMYLTTFENRKERDEHWKVFGSDPYWKKLSAMPEYQNNVSHIDITFLFPTDYSDF